MMSHLAPLTADVCIAVAPELEQRASRLLARLRANSATYADFSSTMNARLMAGEPASQVLRLTVSEHPLTELVRVQRPDFMPYNRSAIQDELYAAQASYSARCATLASMRQESVAVGESLEARLCGIAASIGVARQFRSSGVMAWGSPDTGNVVFPPQQFIASQLEVLEDLRQGWRQEHPLLGAILSMVLLKRIHPFPDSNGRSIRGFFSVELSELLGVFVYVPWTLAASLNPICWHLRMREAQSRLQFDGYVSHALQIIEGILSSATTAELQ